MDAFKAIERFKELMKAEIVHFDLDEAQEEEISSSIDYIANIVTEEANIEK